MLEAVFAHYCTSTRITNEVNTGGRAAAFWEQLDAERVAFLRSDIDSVAEAGARSSNLFFYWQKLGFTLHVPT